MPMRAACEPVLDLWRLVGRIVVHHEVAVWPLGDRGVDPLEEVEELGCPMHLVAFPDNGAGGNVERGEQGCRAVADVGLGAPRRTPRRPGPASERDRLGQDFADKVRCWGW